MRLRSPVLPFYVQINMVSRLCLLPLPTTYKTEKPAYRPSDRILKEGKTLHVGNRETFEKSSFHLELFFVLFFHPVDKRREPKVEVNKTRQYEKKHRVVESSAEHLRTPAAPYVNMG